VGPATERVAAAAEAAHGGPDRLVLTARADNSFHGIDDLDDTIGRLQAFEQMDGDTGACIHDSAVDSVPVCRTC